MVLHSQADNYTGNICPIWLLRYMRKAPAHRTCAGAFHLLQKHAFAPVFLYSLSLSILWTSSLVSPTPITSSFWITIGRSTLLPFRKVPFLDPSSFR